MPLTSTSPARLSWLPCPAGGRPAGCAAGAGAGAGAGVWGGARGGGTPGSHRLWHVAGAPAGPTGREQGLSRSGRRGRGARRRGSSCQACQACVYALCSNQSSGTSRGELGACVRLASMPPNLGLPCFCWQMLRLEPHVVISNRTAVPLQLLQSRLELVAPPSGARPPAAGRPSGAVVAEGGSSFTQISRGVNAAPQASGGAAPPPALPPALLCVPCSGLVPASASQRTLLAAPLMLAVPLGCCAVPPVQPPSWCAPPCDPSVQPGCGPTRDPSAQPGWTEQRQTSPVPTARSLRPAWRAQASQPRAAAGSACLPQCCREPRRWCS